MDWGLHLDFGDMGLSLDFVFWGGECLFKIEFCLGGGVGFTLISLIILS